MFTLETEKNTVKYKDGDKNHYSSQHLEINTANIFMLSYL